MEEKQDLVFFVLSGALIMVTIAFMVIYLVIRQRKKYLVQENELLRIKNETEQNVLKAIIKTQEEERNRIATNLHDSVGAELSMLKLNLSKYIYFLKDTDFNTDYFTKDINNLDNTIETIRMVCKDLYPIMLENYGFIKTFHEICDRLNITGDIACKFRSQIAEDGMGPDFIYKLDLFRICQEVLNNIIKYAHCTAMQISITSNGKKMLIAFEHNGNAFTNKDAEQLIVQNKGIGLSSIKNRISLIEGRIDYLGRHNGSDVKIEIPL